MASHGSPAFSLVIKPSFKTLDVRRIVQMEETTMATPPSTAACQRSFDDRGQAVRLTEDEIRQRNALALAALEAVEEIGDDAEQRETLDYLIRVVDEDRLSDRLRFGS
jgi:hypothetical protein